MIEPEIEAQLKKWRTGEDPAMWQGAVPDMSKLQASIQTDPNGLWWAGAKCAFCEFEASAFHEQYACDEHWHMIIGEKRE